MQREDRQQTYHEHNLLALFWNKFTLFYLFLLLFYFRSFPYNEHVREQDYGPHEQLWLCGSWWLSV